MRFSEFKSVEYNFLKEAKGIFGREAGDKFVHGDGREYAIVEVVAFPDAQTKKFESPEDRDAAIEQFENDHHEEIEWVNTPAANLLAYAVAVLADQDGGHVYWGKYLQFIKPNMLGVWANKEVPAGWNLLNKNSQKLKAGFDPQNLIKTERKFVGVDSIIRTVESNTPDAVRNTFVEALKDLSQGKGGLVFPGLSEQLPAIRDYFGEIMQPVGLMGGVILGQAEEARQLLAGGANWRDCTVFWPMAMNAALCDSFIIAPNGQEIGISSKGGSGAKASAKNLYDAYKKAEKEGNQELIDNAQFTIKICTIIAEESAKNGPIKICEYLGVEGIDQELQQEIDQYMETGKSDLEGISAKAVAVLKPYRVQLSTKGFNAGFALLSAVAKTAASAINEKPEFSKGALLLLNQSSIIQIYTKMNKKGEDAVLTDFKSVYPPNFQGELKVDGGKNYYSSRVGGKMAFYFS